MTHTPGECRICKLVDMHSMEMPTPEEIGTIIAERVRRWIDEDGNYTFLYAELEDGSVLCDIGNGPRGDKYALRIAALWNMAERLRLTTEEIKAKESMFRASADMLKALEWYGWKVDEHRKNTLEGDRARYDLDRDGGSRAYAAIRKARDEE